MKIKTYFTGVLALSLFLALNGCKDDSFLNEKSYSMTSDNAYKTPAQFKMALYYLYNRMQYLTYGQDGPHNYVPNGIGLDTFFSSTVSYGTNNWAQLNSTDGYCSHWYNNLYVMIKNANTILANVDNAGITWTTTTEKDEVKAEALFFRAFAHRTLAGLFGDVPICTEAVTTFKVDYVRSPREDVWKQCKTDLVFAAQNLPKTATQPGRVTRAAADHLLAEILICLKDYDGAIAAATRVIGTGNGDGVDGVYRLMANRFGTRKDEVGKNVYWDLFRQNNFNYQQGNQEAIFVVQYDYQTAQSATGGSQSSFKRPLIERHFVSSFQYYPNSYGKSAMYFPDGSSSVSGCDSTGQGSGFNPPTNYFKYKVWENCGDDYRGSRALIQRDLYQASGKPWKQAFAELVASGKSIPRQDTLRYVYPRFWKFSTDKHYLGNPAYYNCDFYIMRLAETYLLRAEAYMDKSELKLASDDINAVRGRSHAPLISQNDVTLDYILDERARELYGEEYRWITLSRLSSKANPLLVNRVRKYGYGWDEYGGTPSIADYQWIFPIPQTAIDANTGAVLTQNEGYK